MGAKRFMSFYEGKPVDLTDFLDHHPAGRSIIEPYEDKDLTAAFDEVGHSDYAKKRLAQLVEETAAAAGSAASSNPYKSSTSTVPRKPVDWAFVRRKLFTPEDRFGTHKILGALSLMSFIYRYAYVWPTTGSLGFTGKALDYWTLFVHFMLSFSSFLFHVLPARNVKKPLVIYEEYRLHAIVFTARACGVGLFGLLWSELLHPSSVAASGFRGSSLVAPVSLVAFILVIHLVVDWITAKHGTPGVTAVRNEHSGSDAQKAVLWVPLRYFYSYYQFLALGSHLIIFPELADLGYNTIIAIQSSAFLMTLRRKNLAAWYTHVIWYTLALVLSMGYMFQIQGPRFFAVILFAFLLRSKANMSKYTLWAAYVVYVYAIQR